MCNTRFLWRYTFAAVALGLLVLALAACGGSGGEEAASGSEAGGSRTVKMTMLDEFRFRPATVAVKPGQAVTIELVNKGALIHDFSTRGLPQDVKVVVQGGKKGTVTFTAPSQPGEYVFFCSQPGHEAAGMKGILRVK